MFGNAAPRDDERRWILERVASDDDLCVRPGERRAPGEHFVQDTGEAVDIAASVDVGLSRRLLGAHVGWRTNGDAGFCDSIFASSIDRAGDAEIGDERMAVAEENVFGLDVPVHDAFAVREVERGCYFHRDLNGVFENELTLAI